MNIDFSWRSISEPPKESDGLRKLIDSIEQLTRAGKFCFNPVEFNLTNGKIVRGKYYYNTHRWIPYDSDIDGSMIKEWRPDVKDHGGVTEEDSSMENNLNLDEISNQEIPQILNTSSLKVPRPLFHFTRHFDSLLGIIREGFNHRVNNEHLPLRGASRGTLSDTLSSLGAIDHLVTAPLVCFCDIPLEQTKDHSDEYGAYAIGLTKKWALENNITPARYIHANSPDLIKPEFYEASEMIQTIIGTKKYPSRYLIESFGVDESLIDPIVQTIYRELDNQLIKLALYIQHNVFLLKEYEGKWNDRVSGLPCNRLFFDEREWRSVRSPDQADNLNFKWKDVTHTIVQTIEEKETLIVEIMKLQDKLEIGSEAEVPQKIFLLNEVVE